MKLTFLLVAAPYLEDAQRAERRLRHAHDDPLGFGLGDVVALATPVIALVSGSVVTALSDGVADSVRRPAGGFLHRVVHRVRRRMGMPVPESPTTEWTTDQLAAVRQVALTRAQNLGMTQDRAEALRVRRSEPLQGTQFNAADKVIHELASRSRTTRSFRYDSDGKWAHRHTSRACRTSPTS